MARNKGHNFKSISSLKRKERNLETKKLFIVACEGICTEPNYLKSLFNYLMKDNQIARGSFVIADHQHSDPSGVLNDLFNSPEYSNLFDEKWIVIDRDEVRQGKNGPGGHTKENFCAAIKDAASNGVKVAWSNPCFELWLFLHFNYRDTACDREDMQESVLKLLIDKNILSQNDSIDDMKSKKDLFSFLLPYQGNAMRNARRLMAGKENGNPENCNPGTTFHELVQCLKNYRNASNKKSWNDKKNWNDKNN